MVTQGIKTPAYGGPKVGEWSESFLQQVRSATCPSPARHLTLQVNRSPLTVCCSLFLFGDRYKPDGDGGALNRLDVCSGEPDPQVEASWAAAGSSFTDLYLSWKRLETLWDLCFMITRVPSTPSSQRFWGTSWTAASDPGRLHQPTTVIQDWIRTLWSGAIRPGAGSGLTLLVWAQTKPLNIAPLNVNLITLDLIVWHEATMFVQSALLSSMLGHMMNLVQVEQV